MHQPAHARLGHARVLTIINMTQWVHASQWHDYEQITTSNEPGSQQNGVSQPPGAELRPARQAVSVCPIVSLLEEG